MNRDSRRKLGALLLRVHSSDIHAAGSLLPLSGRVDGADLGLDPRDAALASRAFGIKTAWHTPGLAKTGVPTDGFSCLQNAPLRCVQ